MWNPAERQRKAEQSANKNSSRTCLISRMRSQQSPSCKKFSFQIFGNIKDLVDQFLTRVWLLSLLAMASRMTAARVVLQKAIWCGLRLTALPKGLMNPYRRVTTWTSTSARELRVIFTIRIYEFYAICCWIWGGILSGCTRLNPYLSR